MPNVFTGRVVLTEVDVRHAYEVAHPRAPRFANGLAPFLGISFLLYVLQGARVLPLCFVVCALTAAAIALMPWWLARRYVHGKSASDLTVAFELDEAGFSARSASSQGRNAWQVVQQVREGLSTFLIYLNPVLFQILPKRAFPQDELAQIRQLLQTRIAPPRPMRRWVIMLVVWLVVVGAFLLQYLGTSRPGH
jgi:hypothetical protein